MFVAALRKSAFLNDDRLVRSHKGKCTAFISMTAALQEAVTQKIFSLNGCYSFEGGRRISLFPWQYSIIASHKQSFDIAAQFRGLYEFLAF